MSNWPDPNNAVFAAFRLYTVMGSPAWTADPIVGSWEKSGVGNVNDE